MSFVRIIQGEGSAGNNSGNGGSNPPPDSPGDLDVAPTLAPHDVAYGGGVEPKLASQDALEHAAGGELSDFKDVVLPDGGAAMAFAAGLISNAPPFGDPVKNVVLVGSQEKVVGIDASTVVALVQNVDAARDLAPMECPRKPVRRDIFDAVPGHAIAKASVDVPRPEPAPTHWLRGDVLLKSLQRGSWLMARHHSKMPEASRRFARSAQILAPEAGESE